MTALPNNKNAKLDLKCNIFPEKNSPAADSLGKMPKAQDGSVTLPPFMSLICLFSN